MFDFFFKAIIVAICCVFLFWMVTVITAVNVVTKQDWSGGIQPVIERMWCGEPGCMGQQKDKAE